MGQKKRATVIYSAEEVVDISFTTKDTLVPYWDETAVEVTLTEDKHFAVKYKTKTSMFIRTQPDTGSTDGCLSGIPTRKTGLM